MQKSEKLDEPVSAQLKKKRAKPPQSILQGENEFNSPILPKSGQAIGKKINTVMMGNIIRRKVLKIVRKNKGQS